MSMNIGIVGRQDPSEMLSRLFKRADADKNGSISKDEFISALSKKDTSHSANKVINLFDKIDTDKDGSLSASERDTFLKTMANQMQARAQTYSAQLFAQAGSIPSEEDKNDLFSTLDANGDGKIDKSEFSVGLEKLKASLQSSTADTTQTSSTALSNSNKTHHHRKRGDNDTDNNAVNNALPKSSNTGNSNASVKMISQYYIHIQSTSVYQQGSSAQAAQQSMQASFNMVA